MLAVADIAALLVSLGVTVPVVDGYWMPPDPDRLVLVSFAGGKGLLYERAYDSQTVQLRCRGLQRQPADAALLAAQVDDAILSIVPPVDVGANHVNNVDRLGGPPRFQLADTGLRAEYVAQYMFDVAR